MRKIVFSVIAAIAAGALSIAAMAIPASAGNGQPDRSKPRLIESTTTAAAAWSCPTGYVCFWDSSNGVGNRCAWYNDDPDWLTGNARCSWADNRNARSIRNSGRYEAVQYWAGRNYSGSYQLIEPGIGGNPGYGNINFRARSHKWYGAR
ncbi:MAG: peptidase inhibitor family I36 protein [Angustibacter sp.]